MSEQDSIKVTGYIMPVGDGAVGKSSLVFNLNGIREKALSVGKTRNLEFEYVTDKLSLDGVNYSITQQFLVPPGQKRIEGTNDKRCFEDVLDIYRFMIKRLDVILLCFSLNSVESFQNLDYWLETVLGLCTKISTFILLGTHLDLHDQREVTREMLEQGVGYLQEKIQLLKPGWSGECSSVEISNTSGENANLLRKRISLAILRTKSKTQTAPLQFVNFPS